MRVDGFTKRMNGEEVVERLRMLIVEGWRLLRG